LPRAAAYERASDRELPCCCVCPGRALLREDKSELDLRKPPLAAQIDPSLSASFNSGARDRARQQGDLERKFARVPSAPRLPAHQQRNDSHLVIVRARRGTIAQVTTHHHLALDGFAWLRLRLATPGQRALVRRG
jgi:hypothetical protein